jgi:hypothetical protein
MDNTLLDDNDPPRIKLCDVRGAGGARAGIESIHSDAGSTQPAPPPQLCQRAAARPLRLRVAPKLPRRRLTRFGLDLLPPAC